MAFNRCIVKELYVEQREYRCTAPSARQQALIDQLRDMLYKKELDEVIAHKTATEAIERARIRRCSTDRVKKAMERCLGGEEKTSTELLQAVKNHWKDICVEELCGEEVVQPFFFLDNRTLYYEVPEPVLKEVQTVAKEPHGDGRQLPKYAWEDIHHRFLETYGNSCRIVPTGFYDPEDEETGQKSKTAIIKYAASGKLLVELDLGLDYGPASPWSITIESVAEDLGRWARRTRRPISEGILQNACTFMTRKEGEGTRKLERHETLNNIFGNSCLVTLELVVNVSGGDASGDLNRWFELGRHQRERTMKGAIKALRSTTSTNRHLREFDHRLQMWLFPWEPELMRDYQDWEPLTVCSQCYHHIEGLVYCFSCPKALCTRCCIRSGWPLKNYNVMCEDCTEALQEALVE